VTHGYATATPGFGIAHVRGHEIGQDYILGRWTGEATATPGFGIAHVRGHEISRRAPHRRSVDGGGHGEGRRARGEAAARPLDSMACV
jgi:hypothetical protein